MATFDMNATAKTLGVNRTRLVDALEAHRIFYRDAFGYRVPTREYVQRGYFFCKTSGHWRGPVLVQRNKAMATSEGIAFLREFIRGHNLESDLQAKTCKH